VLIRLIFPALVFFWQFLGKQTGKVPVILMKKNHKEEKESSSQREKQRWAGKWKEREIFGERDSIGFIYAQGERERYGQVSTAIVWLFTSGRATFWEWIGGWWSSTDHTVSFPTPFFCYLESLRTQRENRYRTDKCQQR
jgi:hypothetical protein